MQKQLVMGALMTIAIAGFSGCPSEDDKTIRPGVWSFETYDANGNSRGAGGIRLFEDGSTQIYLLNGAYVAFATGWFQLGETFTLELENPGGATWERLWFTAKIDSETSLVGDGRNADTGDVMWPFTAEWVAD